MLGVSEGRRYFAKFRISYPDFQSSIYPLNQQSQVFRTFSFPGVQSAFHTASKEVSEEVNTTSQLLSASYTTDELLSDSATSLTSRFIVNSIGNLGNSGFNFSANVPTVEANPAAQLSLLSQTASAAVVDTFVDFASPPQQCQLFHEQPGQLLSVWGKPLQYFSHSQKFLRDPRLSK